VPLIIQPEAPSPVCKLSIWSVADAVSFIDVLAWLYLRKPTHASKVIQALEPGSAGFGGREFENAIALLRHQTADIAANLLSSDAATAEKAKLVNDARVALRDGLLFQHVSWVAAALQFPTAKSRSPHVRKADKGFDGLLIEVGKGALSRVVLCEDKATTNPRDQVTQRVWPEVKLVVAGDKDLEILDAVTALLDTMMSDDEREAVLISATWQRSREFRIAVTAAPTDLRPDGYGHIFGGYDTQVAGDVGVRMAEVMPLPDVRGYFEGLAGRVVARLQEMAAHV
jgi:hypothetical protein